jgi:glycosyltransferase involved in cell wall biosynthesis
MNRDLTIVIPTVGRPALLRRTLASLEACRKPDTFSGIIIVENGHKNGTEEVVRSYNPRLKVRYIYIPQASQSLAKNKALEVVADGLIIFTDDDVRFHPHTLCAYAGAAAGNVGGEFYGGPIGVDYQIEPPEWLTRYLPPSARGWRLEGNKQFYNKPEFLGCNWAAFLSDIRDAGGFDPKFGFGGTAGGTGEETNLQDRLLQGGLKGVYLPDAMVWHYVPVERCSPQWAKKRAYLHGVEAGLNHVTKGRTLFGFSRWMLSAWPRSAFEVLKTSLGSDLEARFRARYKFRSFCGFIHGNRLAQRVATKMAKKSGLYGMTK